MMRIGHGNPSGAISFSRLDKRPLLDVMIPGMYAWCVTVAWPLLGERVTGWAYLSGVLALLALLASGVSVLLVERLWSAVPVSLFIVASALVWILVGDEAPNLGWIGSLGWAVFAVGWVRACGTRAEAPATVATTLELAPRRVLSRLARVNVVLGVVGALALWGFAHLVVDRERSLLAHGLALLGGLYLLAATSDGATQAGQKATSAQFPVKAAGLALLYGGVVAGGCWLTFF